MLLLRTNTQYFLFLFLCLQLGMKTFGQSSIIKYCIILSKFSYLRSPIINYFSFATTTYFLHSIQTILHFFSANHIHVKSLFFNFFCFKIHNFSACALEQTRRRPGAPRRDVVKQTEPERQWDEQAT